ncbi:MAG TPA: NUDIX hydrolase [Actinomycetota bacterium]
MGVTVGGDPAPEVVAESGRRFSTTPAAVLVFVVDDRDRILVFRHPTDGYVEVVNGGVEAGETILQAAERELREEAGTELRARILGVFHAYTYRYDDRVPRMTSLAFVASHEGGAARAGDDVAGSSPVWFSAPALANGDEGPTIPEETWLFTAAADAARAWRGRHVDLDPYV